MTQRGSIGCALSVRTHITVLIFLLVSGVAASQQQGAVRRHVEFLASDDLGGRLTGSAGAQRAADVIQASFSFMPSLLEVEP